MMPLITIQYIFNFQNDVRREIILHLDGDTLKLQPLGEHAPPPWADLKFHTCLGCPLDPANHPHCPIALHLPEIIEVFREHNSYDNVTVEVIDSRRHYLKETSPQEGLGSLIGIIMTTGGCPVMAPLRPMVRFHLPFATLEETEFRMISMYLVSQYLLMKKGKEPDWSLDGLQAIYDRVRDVNLSFAKRIRSASQNDVGVNAVIILDCFAQAIPFAIRTLMKDYEKYFEEQ